MKKLSAEEAEIKLQEKRQKARYDYYIKTGLNHQEATMRAGPVGLKQYNGKTKERDYERERQLKREQRERAKRKAMEETPFKLPLDKCPLCGGEFFKRLGKTETPQKITRCNDCGVSFWISGNVPEELRKA